MHVIAFLIENGSAFVAIVEVANNATSRPPVASKLRGQRTISSMAAAATVAAMMLLLAAVISAEEQCSNDEQECGGGQTHLHEVSSRLRHVVAPPPFPPFIVRSTNELSPPNDQFSGILRRLKQVPCRGNVGDVQ